MRLPFVKKKGRDSESGDEYRAEEYPVLENKAAQKGGRILARIALCIGVFIVFVAAIGGYFYIDSTRWSLNKRISANPPALVKGIDLGKGEGATSSRDTQFIEVQPGDAAQSAQLPPSNRPVPQAAPVGDHVTNGAPVQNKPTPPERSVPVEEVSPPPGEKTGRTSGAATAAQAAPVQPETLLNQLVLRDDNPFRDKFLKRFENSQAPKTRRKNSGSSRSPRSGNAGKLTSDLTGNELAILPSILGGSDLPADLKVVGVIQTQNTSIALTNKGELKVGSVVDGDSVTGITMNEVHLKSGRTLKVTAQ
ncbi:MAG: hypothetical protein KA801_19240 [Syntrophorhabdaceae bacterium]|nr:hypothetical protein [Syntrophorhabdaceae bacterium]